MFCVLYETQIVILELLCVSLMGLHFSKSFSSTASRLMSLYGVAILEGLPGLRMSIMMDNFQITEK